MGSEAIAIGLSSQAGICFQDEQSATDVIDGERKTVTALFADIKGSMELMEDLDPEQARAIVDPALKLMIDAVRRYSGYIVQSTGDGIFALFGAPIAHEDHPQRALYAALRLQEEMRRYGARMRAEKGLNLEARVGVNTGEVVVRSIQTKDGQPEYTPIGHSTALAARLQTLASPGSVVIGPSLRGLAEGYFQLKPLGLAQIKGVKEPLELFEVSGLGPLRTRLQVAARRGLTRFLGREAEIARMQHALQLAGTGHGQVVAVMGEPGVGKSRLFFEFKALAQSGSLVLEAYSVSHGKASAYLPVIDLLKNYFKIEAGDDERAKREKVAGKIVVLDRALEDSLPCLYSLLGINEDDELWAQIDPQLRRRRTHDAIKRILMRESMKQPLIVIFEDLHWIDSETQALLNLVVDSLATARLLLLINYRPEYRHEWGSKSYYNQLSLEPFSRETAEQMLTELVGDADELGPLKQLIIQRTEGNPFFLEEMVHGLFDQGVLVRNGATKLAKPLSGIRIPPTVQALLASRIDRLESDEKELLQTAAVLGREFTLELIRKVYTCAPVSVLVGAALEPPRVSAQADPRAPLDAMLDHLQLAEFIYEQPGSTDLEYIFKHALTQEVAYHSILMERRRLLHERAAEAIEELFVDRLEDHVSDLARHYERSGNLPKAIDYLQREGARAARQTAHSEAITCFSRALELLNQLPDSGDRARRELDLLVSQSASVSIVKGQGAPECGTLIMRALQLSEQWEHSRLPETLLRLARFHFFRRESHEARELIHRALPLAESSADSRSALADAHLMLGWTEFDAGHLQAVLRHMERVLELVDFAPGNISGPWGGILVISLSLVGFPAAAISKSREWLTAARKLSDPVSISYALNIELFLRVEIREPVSVSECLPELLAIAVEHGLPYQLALATFFRGWLLAEEGRGDQGIVEMYRGISIAEGPAAFLIAPMSRFLARACGRFGRAEEGLAVLAPEIARKDGDSANANGLGDLFRLKGELLLIQDSANAAVAEEYFRTAIRLNRDQGAKWWELTATTNLARLLKQQRKTDEARRMLGEIYNWFTEGFDTADLKDAKALLDELSA